MKIELLLHENTPVIVFLGDMDHEKRYLIWSPSRSYGRATRANLRTMRKPETMSEQQTVFLALGEYCGRFI